MCLEEKDLPADRRAEDIQAKTGRRFTGCKGNVQEDFNFKSEASAVACSLSVFISLANV